jgi:hypothetical protein
MRPSRRRHKPLKRQSAEEQERIEIKIPSEARSHERRCVLSTELVRVVTSIKPLAEWCARGASASGPDRLRRTGRDAHLHLHAEMVRREPDEGAMERDRVVRIADDRNGDKAALADVAARGVEIDPADARQIDLRPGMG